MKARLMTDKEIRNYPARTPEFDKAVRAFRSKWGRNPLLYAYGLEVEGWTGFGPDDAPYVQELEQRIAHLENQLRKLLEL